jgi:hypothetical protein
MSRGASIYFASLLINSNMTQDLKTPNSMDLTGLCRENLGLRLDINVLKYSSKPFSIIVFGKLDTIITNGLFSKNAYFCFISCGKFGSSSILESLIFARQSHS